MIAGTYVQIYDVMWCYFMLYYTTALCIVQYHMTSYHTMFCNVTSFHITSNLITISHTTPHFSPQTTPHFSPHTTPHFSPHTTPHFSPHIRIILTDIRTLKIQTTGKICSMISSQSLGRKYRKIKRNTETMLWNFWILYMKNCNLKVSHVRLVCACA